MHTFKPLALYHILSGPYLTVRVTRYWTLVVAKLGQSNAVRERDMQ